jgi:YD repeat-containing protein
LGPGRATLSQLSPPPGGAQGGGKAVTRLGDGSRRLPNLRLRGIWVFSSTDAFGHLTTFEYDALERRASKTINGHATHFRYDGLDIVQESGPAGVLSHLRSLAIDEVLATTDGATALAPLADALGSTVTLTDATGAPASNYTYAPLGDTAANGAPSANPFQFTGRENDGTGLY